MKLVVSASHPRGWPRFQRKASGPVRFECGMHAPDRADRAYSTVTDLARLRGWSTSFPMKTAVW